MKIESIEWLKEKNDENEAEQRTEQNMRKYGEMEEAKKEEMIK